MQRLLCVIGSFRLTRNGLPRQTANRTANIPSATIRENLRFLTICGPFDAFPDFPCKPSPRLPSRQTNRRKAVRTEVSNNEGTDTSGGCLARAVPKPSERNLSIAYWATAIRRAARFRRRRAWASRDSSSRCSSRCSGWAASQRSGSRASKAAVSPGSMAAIRRGTSVRYGQTYSP